MNDPDLWASAQEASAVGGLDLPGAIADRILNKNEVELIGQIRSTIGPAFVEQARRAARECRAELKAEMRARLMACMIGAAVDYRATVPIAMN